MTTLSNKQQIDVIRAVTAVANAWESNVLITEGEMCNHLEEILKVMEGKNDFYDFLIAIDFNMNEQHWIN